ncbi:MAG: hypothetical protein JW839_03945, partial [Candidatus Lokiarchaeota archaeon]|nr:hypothetical protein [Candidatus Lokiarchaeota archaeon]
TCNKLASHWPVKNILSRKKIRVKNDETKVQNQFGLDPNNKVFRKRMKLFGWKATFKRTTVEFVYIDEGVNKSAK